MMPFARPNKNHVIASEAGGVPAQFRAANQLRLVPARAMNKSVSDTLAYLPGNDGLACMSGNGMGDNGLTSRAATQRLAKKLAQMRMMQQAKLGQIQDAGSPDASPVPYADFSFEEAYATGVALPQPGDAGSVVATVPRNQFQSWDIVARDAGTGSSVYHAELWQTQPDGSQQQLDQSDPMNTPQDAANYIQAQEFRQGALYGKQAVAATLPTQIASAGYANGGATARGSFMVPDTSAPVRPWSGMSRMARDPVSQTQALLKPVTGGPVVGSAPPVTHDGTNNPFAALMTPSVVPDHIMAPTAKTWQIVAYSQNNQVIYNAELVQSGPGGVRNTLVTSPDFTTTQDAHNWIAANPVPGASLDSVASAVPSAQMPNSVPWNQDPFQANAAWNMQARQGAQTNLTPFEVSRLQLDGLGDDTTPAPVPAPAVVVTDPAATTIFGMSTGLALGVGVLAVMAYYMTRPIKATSTRRARTFGRAKAARKDDFLLLH